MLVKAVTAALLLASSAVSTPIFQNRGTSSGWDFTNEEHQGTVAEVSNLALEGSTSLKATQIYDGSYSGRYHSEVGKRDIYRRGDQGFYGFSFRLQENWEFEPAQSYNLAQFIADFGDTGCDDYMPSSMVWLVGNQLYSRVKSGDICDQHTETFRDLATVSAGEWHTVIIQANWQSGDNGFYKVWFDGEKVFDRSNIATTVNDGRAFEYRVGLYANGWHDDGELQGSQGTRQVWYDAIAAGTTYADVDPAQW